MITKITYKTFDGEEFSDKSICLKHEKYLTDSYNYIKNGTKFYDSNFNLLPFPTVEEFYRGLEYKYLDDIAMISTDTECFSDIDCFFDRAGECTKIINQPSEIDLYVYDEEWCSYVPIDEKAIDALTFVKKLQSLGLIPGLEQIIAERENAEYRDEEDANE